MNNFAPYFRIMWNLSWPLKINLNPTARGGTRSGQGQLPVPPLRSDFPDFGPIPDFFHKSGPEKGPDLQPKSGF